MPEIRFMCGGGLFGAILASMGRRWGLIANKGIDIGRGGGG